MPLDYSKSRLGGSTVVVVEALDRARYTSVRVATAFASANLGDVLLCHWHDLSFLQDVVVASGGVKYDVKGDGIVEEVAFRDDVEPSALFFYAPNSGFITKKDLAFLERLTAAGIDVDQTSAYAVVDKILLEASRRGLVTNAIGPDRRWGPKHQQESKLRRYEAATGRYVPRPSTYVGTPSQLPRLISQLARRTDMCIIKPAFGDRGRGIEIVSPDDWTAWTITEDCVILQELLSDPLLIDGHKADLRCYLLIDVDNVISSGRHGPIFVRRAPAAYRRGMVAAEVTNTDYRVRRGMPPDILPLDQVLSIDDRLRDAIVSQLEVLLCELTQVYFWDARCSRKGMTPQRVPNRVVLFGVDVLVTVSGSGQPALYFLEVNPLPAFYRGSIPCDIAIDEMLAGQYLPALLYDQGGE
jgi:Tubulin-tyrosine ligase family